MVDDANMDAASCYVCDNGETAKIRSSMTFGTVSRLDRFWFQPFEQEREDKVEYDAVIAM